MLSENEAVAERRIDPGMLRNTRDARIRQLLEWLAGVCPAELTGFEPASGDASFRRYFRLILRDRTLIAMDAPPANENIRSFIQVCRLFQEAGVHVPEIIDFNLDQGFMLLGDLGSTSYLSKLDAECAPRLYADAMEVLAVLGHGMDIQSCGLPDYGEALLRRELSLFEEWFLRAKLEIDLSDAELKMIGRSRDFLIAAMLDQPKIVVHRDFHSRNLMVVEQRNPGVLDFQDAVVGPLTYDLVSLLRDCYIAWPESKVQGWVRDFFSGLGLKTLDFEQFYRWFELAGIQRHLKAVGIFSRLDLRDAKPGYLADIPRTLDYIVNVAGRYRELGGFHDFLTQVAAERFEAPRSG